MEGQLWCAKESSILKYLGLIVQAFDWLFKEESNQGALAC